MPNGPDPYLTESDAPTWPGAQAAPPAPAPPPYAPQAAAYPAPPPYASPASAPYNVQAPPPQQQAPYAQYAQYAPYPPAAAPQQQGGRGRGGRGGARLGVTFRLALLISFALSIVEALLVVRIALELLAANPEANFTSLILGLTDPLVAPFQGVFPTLAALQGHALDTAALLALVVYALATRVLLAAMRLVTR